ncbi:MAG TPA: redoxin domain-containing protein [Chthonomonadaceae bacterium]|nr:redoxin domain-containing protein [Chthonomonadaceae bacterium]
MHPSPSEIRSSLPGGERRRILFLLGALLLIAGALGVRMTLRSHPAAPGDLLHGNANDASAALSAVLAKTPADQRLPLLLRYVQDPGPGLRYAAVDALGEEHSEAAVMAIENAFADSSAAVRERAMETLLQVAPDRGRRLLASALRDDDSVIREAAILQWLQQAHRYPTAARPAVPALLASLDDTDPVVPLFASDALSALTGKPWRIQKTMTAAQRQAALVAWQAWWRQAGPGWKGAAAFAAIPPIRPDRADPAPALHLRDLDGVPIDLETLRGRVTLLNFWGTWCGPCQMEIPDLIRLDSAYRARNLNLIGVAISEPDGAASLRRWCAAHGIRYRQALGDDAAQRAYGLEGVPVSVLLDGQGRIRYRWEGPRDFATFRKAIDRLLTDGAG